MCSLVSCCRFVEKNAFCGVILLLAGWFKADPNCAGWLGKSITINALSTSCSVASKAAMLVTFQFALASIKVFYVLFLSFLDILYTDHSVRCIYLQLYDNYHPFQ